MSRPCEVTGNTSLRPCCSRRSGQPSVSATFAEHMRQSRGKIVNETSLIERGEMQAAHMLFRGAVRATHQASHHGQARGYFTYLSNGLWWMGTGCLILCEASTLLIIGADSNNEHHASCNILFSPFLSLSHFSFFSFLCTLCHSLAMRIECLATIS